MKQKVFTVYAIRFNATLRKTTRIFYGLVVLAMTFSCLVWPSQSYAQSNSPPHLNNFEGNQRQSPGPVSGTAKNAERCEDLQAENGSEICAQWAAVRAAQESANAASWTLYVSAVGLFLLVLTLFATAYAAFAARDAALGLVQSERPHVRLFTTIKTKDKLGRILSTQGVTFKNFGRTPALIRKLRISYVLADGPPDPEKESAFERIYPDDSVIGHGETWPYKGFVPQFQGRTVNDLIKIHKKTGERLFVFGKIVYIDSFGKEHYTRFCREFTGRSFTYNRNDVDHQKNLNYAT
ncbi:hypothetical protein CN311_08325 [Mesorhizobium sanjuanii]|uniref:Uncharacterized protein n=1 Tax=Mesorhizobium sanjuanii TaxID=2037900 RepID=A0A2A6FJ06_9HYPH|nr:hypothetical protein [Mesorhizobium sanjuanii]PDQ21646.1 hypothetical protein CN311_08325 [Mesorhizobium sanjuanii]